MELKFFGTRGSIPVCSNNYTKYGGNTFCISVTCNNSMFIIDAGSGIRFLGKEIIENEKKTGIKFSNITIGFTHFHWDHIQGFPFFLPAYDNERNITIMAMGKNNDVNDLRGIFATQMQKEYYPVPLEKMGANFVFYKTKSDEEILSGLIISSLLHNHPGGAYTLKLERNGKKVVISTDIEHQGKIDKNLISLAKDADILIHDAQYSPEELKHKKGWGHSSWEEAVEFAKQSGIKKLYLTHHDPDHNDTYIDELEKNCKKVFNDSEFAKEGMIISL